MLAVIAKAAVGSGPTPSWQRLHSNLIVSACPRSTSLAASTRGAVVVAGATEGNDVDDVDDVDEGVGAGPAPGGSCP